MSSSDQVQVQVQANGHAPQENGNGNSDTSSFTSSTTTEPALPVVGQLNEQRRIFLKSTIQESNEESREDVATTPDAEPQLRRQTPPPNTLTLSVKYATLPSPSVVQSQSALRSPLSPPPKPPMLSRTRSTGSGDARASLTNGERYSVTEQAAPAEEATTATAVVAATATATTQAAITTPTSNHDEQTVSTPPTPATISARHYESLIEELRCPGCAGPLKAPVLLCKSGHSVCEQCTRILLMCPLCKVCNTLPPAPPCS